MNEALLILGMFLVTYSVRLFPFAMAHRIRFAPWLREALSYVPVAALTAIIAPIIIYDDQELIGITADNHQLWAALAAFLFALVKRTLLGTVIVGMGTYFLLRWLAYA